MGATATPTPTPVPAADPLVVRLGTPDPSNQSASAARLDMGTSAAAGPVGVGSLSPGGGGATRVDVCGTIANDTTWTPDNLYVIDCQVIVPAGVTLTVLPGTVVKSPGRFEPASITVHGRFVAEGTLAAPIVFTSIKDDAHGGDTNGDGSATTPAHGDWPSLNFEAGSIGRLSNVLIAYGGVWYEGRALVRCFDADLRLDRVTLRASYEAGVYTRRCKLSITNSTFADNRWHALQLGRWSSGGLAADEPFTLENNHFGPGPAGVVWFDGTPHGPVSIRGNVAVGGTTGLELYGELRNDLDWHNDALPLLLQQGLRGSAGGIAASGSRQPRQVDVLSGRLRRLGSRRGAGGRRHCRGADRIHQHCGRRAWRRHQRERPEHGYARGMVGDHGQCRRPRPCRTRRDPLRRRVLRRMARSRTRASPGR